MADVYDPFKPAPKPVDPNAVVDPFAEGYVAPNTTVGDVAKSVAGGAVQGIGTIFQGGGNLVAQAVNRGSEALTGYNPMLRAADPLKGVEDTILDSRTAGGKLAMELSTPDGNIADPSSWTLGKAPTVGGYVQQAGNVIGQFVGPGIVGVAGKAAKLSAHAQELLGAVQGGLQAGGAAAGQEGDAIRNAKHDKLMLDSSNYRDYIGKGMKPDEARERTALDAELGAGTIGAIPAAAEGAVLQGLLRGKLHMPTIGKGPISEALSAIAGGAIGEGGQEYVEGVAQKLGANLGAGTNQDLNDGSFQNVVLGALGGAAGGGAFHALSPGPHADGEPGAAPAGPTAPGGQLMLPAPVRPMGDGTAANPLPPFGSPDMSTDPRIVANNADANAQSVYAARAAEDARLAGLQDQTPPPPAPPGPPAAPLTLPAPTDPLSKIVPPGESGPDPLTAQHVANAAADHAASVYAARDAEANRLAQFASQGALSTAAAVSMASGHAAQVQGERAATMAGAQTGDSPLAAPTEQVKGTREKPLTFDEQLAQQPTTTLRNAQDAVIVAGSNGHDLTVVPHPTGGYTVIPTKKLSEDQVSAVKGLQQPTPLAATQQRSMPFATEQAAKARADTLTAQTGTEHEVIPHPYARDKFAIRKAPDTIEGTSTAVQDSAVSSNPGQTAGMDKAATFTGRGKPVGLKIGEEAAAAWAKAYPGDQQAPVERRGMKGNDGQWYPYGFAPKAAPAQSASAPTAQSVSDAAHQAATSPTNDLPNPTGAQAAAGNYTKGHVKLHGLDISVENPAGSVRVAKDGSWASSMPHHYGYIRRSEGADGDHVDTFIGPKPESTKVFVVDQVNPKTGKFDEHKVMMGFDTQEAAEAGYKAAYPKEWKGMKAITETSVDGLKQWIGNGKSTQEFGAKYGTEDLAGIQVRTPVTVEDTGETVYIQHEAKDALVDARAKVRSLEALKRCLAR